MPVNHLFYTYDRGGKYMTGDLIEGRTMPGEDDFCAHEHNEWAVLLVTDIEKGDMLTDPNGWWEWWENNRVDEVKVDAWIAGIPPGRRKDKATFTKSRIRKKDKKYKKDVDTKNPADMTWAELKTLCSPRTEAREDLRPEYWDQMAQTVP